MSDVNRTAILSSFGASETEVAELLAYNENAIDPARLELPSLPLGDEAFVTAWEGYAAEACQRGAFAVLRERLVQFRFPIQAEITATDAYRAATRRGVPPAELPEATGLVLQRPEQLQLVMHATPAGRIPLLITPERLDFVRLVQALAWRNEPAPVPPSQGACLVTGLNNWDRIRQLRHEWSAANPTACSDDDWHARFQQIVPQRELYQDSLIVLSEGPYSNVAADELGLTEADWREASLTIRREHECVHYFCRRVLSSRRYNLLDELVADYAGIVHACGSFRADWLLRFLGLESYPTYRAGGRLENYRGQPPLSDGAFQVLQALTWKAVQNLQTLDHGALPRLLPALSSLTLEELAGDRAAVLVHAALRKVEAQPRP